MVTAEYRRCPVCQVGKTTRDFWRKGSAWQGWCKPCVRAWRMSYREIERQQDRKRLRVRTPRVLP